MPIQPDRIRVLLTVPHLSSTASPYREMMAIAKYLPKDLFSLTICSLTERGMSETGTVLNALNVPCLVAKFRPSQYTFKQIGKSLSSERKIAQYGPFDIQHSLDYTSSPFEGIVARLRQRVFIYSQRNLNEGGRPAALILRAQSANRIVTISEAVTTFLVAGGVRRTKLRQIPLGIDDIFRYQSGSNSTPTQMNVLSVGQIIRRKRHEDVIRAISALTGTMPAVHLDIVGPVYDTPYYEELQQLVRGCGLEDRVHFLGVRSDVLDLMRSANILVLCSESEAFGWVILEAMAVGLPVVASAVDGPKTIITNGVNGLLVPVGDTSGYAQAISRVLTESGLSKKLTDNGYREVEERYSAERMVERIAEVYREVVGKG